MTPTVALIGAGGKMGTRIRSNLARCEALAALYCENSLGGIARIEEAGQEVAATSEAVRRADAIVLAVPDVRIGAVSAAVLGDARPGALVVLLDPAAAVAGAVHLRDDLRYAVCHPCHPPLFGEQTTPEARKDFFGGVAAVQDLVLAVMAGGEQAWHEAEQLCRVMFAPVGTVHEVTVDQMAILEPAMAEVVAATAAVLMKEALEQAVACGVPRPAATAFMMGHAQIPLAIAFGAIESPFSDAAKIAIAFGKEYIVRSDWRRVFEPEMVKACIDRMLNPEHNR